MEGVSSAMAQNVVHMGELMDMQQKFWRKQMRAYISVLAHDALYQERDKGIRFEARPLFVNNGHTPAYNLLYDIKCNVVSTPISDSHDFRLPSQDAVFGAVVGPHQNRIMTAIVDTFYDDREVEDIKTGRDRALCVWGTIRYDDAFGFSHFTNFCQIIVWGRGGQIVGYYHKTHNDSD